MRAPDVVVVGAGPAGAASAILLAERGVAVTVLERSQAPRDRICGEYLSPEGARVLDRLGVLKSVDATAAAPLAGMRITAPDGTTVTGRYGPVGAHRPYRDHALGVPRAALDAALRERLRALPVVFREGTRVVDVVRDGDAVAGVVAIDPHGGTFTVRARLVIGADGRSSVIAARLGCRAPHRLRRLAVTTYVTGIVGCREFGEIFVDPPDYAILNPLAAERVNVSLVVPLDHVRPWAGRLDDFLVARVRQLPHLARRLAGARRVAPVRALGPLAYRVLPPRRAGVILVGDAAGFYDPFTGEGMYTALRSAELAADVAVAAFAGNDVSAHALAAYERARRAAFADKGRVSRAIQFVVGRRRLANAVARALAARPGLLARLMGIVGDYLPPREALRR